MFPRLQSLARGLKTELGVYRLVLRHPGTPRRAKWLLGLAVGYFLLPFDIIPDFIPIIGHLDDAVIVPLLVYLAVKMIPPEVISECREQWRARSLADDRRAE